MISKYSFSAFSLSLRVAVRKEIESHDDES